MNAGKKLSNSSRWNNLAQTPGCDLEVKIPFNRKCYLYPVHTKA